MAAARTLRGTLALGAILIAAASCSSDDDDASSRPSDGGDAGSDSASGGSAGGDESGAGSGNESGASSGNESGAGSGNESGASSGNESGGSAGEDGGSSGGSSASAGTGATSGEGGTAGSAGVDGSVGEAGSAGEGGSAAGAGGGRAGAAADAGGAAGAQGGEGGHAGQVYTYDCGAFSTDPGWTVRNGYRAVVVADETDGLDAPIAATFAEGNFGGLLYVVNQDDSTVRSVDVATGQVALVVAGGDWDTAPVLLTTIVWDADGVFDGNLYVGDQGSNSDGDSRIYRVTSAGAATSFATGPGAGMDDIFGLAFPPPGSAYAAGLYVTGDTDGDYPDWGRIASDGTIVTFSEVAGVEGIAFDTTGTYGNSLWASRPATGGYAGDDSITPISALGEAGTPLATGLAGIHAVTFSVQGAFGDRMYAASRSTGTLLQIDPDGTPTELASGLTLSNYDGNILAVSSDGNVMFVADYGANRIVCIEPI